MNKGIDWVEQGLINVSGEITDGYALISHAAFAARLEETAKSVLKEHVCFGVASVPVSEKIIESEDGSTITIPSWQVDMDLYDYTERMGSVDKATVAWAMAALNIKSRDFNKELSTFRNLKVATPQPIKE